MVDSFREAFRRNLAQRQLVQGQMTPPAPRPVFRPVVTDAVQTGQFAAAKAYAAQVLQRTQAVSHPPLTPAQYGGGGGGVVANDILGQRGPVVLSPQYAGQVQETPNLRVAFDPNSSQFQPGSIENPSPIAPTIPDPIPDQYAVPQAERNRFLEENLETTSGFGTPQQMLDMTFQATGQPNVPRQTLAEYEAAKTGDVTPEQAQANTEAAAAEAAGNQAIDDASLQLEIAQGNYAADPSPENNEAVKVAQQAYTDALAAHGDPVPGVEQVMNLVDTPRQLVIEEMGNNAYDVATGEKSDWGAEVAAIAPANWMLPGLDGTRLTQDFEAWVEDPDNWAAIRNATENGFQSALDRPRFEGGRAVWELFINSAGNAYKAVMDVLLDPLVLLQPIQDVGRGAQVLALQDALDAARVSARTGVETGVGPLTPVWHTAGRALTVPQAVMNVTGDLPFEIAGEGVRRLANLRGQGVRSNMIGRLFEENAAGREATQIEETTGALNVAETVNRGQTPGGAVPPGGGIPPQGGTGPGGQPTGAAGQVIPPQTVVPGGVPAGSTTAGPGVTTTGAPTVQTVGDRFTMRHEGNEWVIYNPQGLPTGDRFPWEPTTGAEPPRSTRDVTRHVNALNQPLIQADLLQQGWVLPERINDLTYTSPTYQTVTNRGQALPYPNIQTTVARDSTLGTPQDRLAWLNEWTPKAAEHERVLRDIEARELVDMSGAGVNFERDLVQQGKQLTGPAKVWETVRFVAEDTLLPFQRAFPNAEIPPYRFMTNGTLDRTNTANLIEHAVFGTREDAIIARRILRGRGVPPGVEGFRDAVDFVERLATLGEAINGPAWRSTNASAVKSATIRAARAAEPQDTAAAMGADLNLPGEPPVATAASETPLVTTLPPPRTRPRGRVSDADELRIWHAERADALAVLEPIQRRLAAFVAAGDEAAYNAFSEEVYNPLARAIFDRHGKEMGQTIINDSQPAFQERLTALQAGGTTAVPAPDLPDPTVATVPTPEPVLDPITTPQPPKPKTPRPAKPAVLDPSGDDATIRNLIDTGQRWVTTGKNRVERDSGSRVKVGAKQAPPDQTVYVYPVKEGDDTIWRVKVGSNAQVEDVKIPTLREALAAADELILRAKQGTTPTPAQVKQVTNDVLTQAQAVVDAVPPYDPTALLTGARQPQRYGMQRVDLSRFERVADIPTPAGPVTRGTRDLDGELYTYTKANLDDIRVDLSTFQNRKDAYSKRSVDNIVANFNPRKFEPIEVMQNPDGTYTVLSGHSRHEAWTRLAAAGRVSASDVPIRIQHGTADELRLLAQTSNTRGTGNTPTEKGRLLQNLIDGGMPYEQAIREVNVKGGDAKRLLELNNLSNQLQDLVDNGQLSVTQGAELGQAIRQGTLSGPEADALYYNSIAANGMSDADLRDLLATAARMKAQTAQQQGGLFGGMDLGDSGFAAAADKMIDLNRKVRALRSQESAFKKAAKSAYLDEAGQQSVASAIQRLRADIAGLESDLGIGGPRLPAAGDLPEPTTGGGITDMFGNVGIVPPATARNQALGIRARDAILERGGARMGPSGPKLSDNDTSHVGAAHRMGHPGMDDRTYAILTRWVDYNGERMKLWEAYDRALLDAPGTMDEAAQAAWAKEQVARETLDPRLKAELAAAKATRLRREGTKRWRATFTVLSVYQTWLKVLREGIMYNWSRYLSGPLSDLAGNAYTTLVNGEPVVTAKMLNVLGPTNREFVQAGRKGRELIHTSLPDYERHVAITGKPPPKTALTIGDSRVETGIGQVQMKRTGLFYKLGGRLFADDNIRALRTGVDHNSRYVLYIHEFAKQHATNLRRFRGMVLDQAERTGASPTEWMAKLDALGDDFNSAAVLDAFGDTSLSRAWVTLNSQAIAAGTKRVNDLLFSYKQTNADDLLRNVLFFHYWMSRAAVLHTKTALRNPYLLNAYGRAWDYMEKEAEANGYPDNVLGFVRLMGDQTGMYGLVSPASVLVPFWFLIEGAMAEGDPGTMGFIQRWGGFVNPLVEAAAAVVGATDAVPDITGTRPVRRALRYTVNWLNSNGFEDIVPNQLGDPNTWQTSVVDEAEYGIYNMINQGAMRAANAIAPTQNVIKDYEGTYPSGGEYDTLNSIVINQLEETYGPFDTWEPDSDPFHQLNQAMQDITMGTESNNPLAEAAIEEYADARGEAVPISMILPGGIYQRYGPRDQTLAEARAGEEQAYDQREIAISGNPTLAIQLDEMERLGTEAGRQGYALWNEIVYTENLEPGYIVINGEGISTTQVEQMDEDDRKELADRWLAQYEGVPAEKDEFAALRSAYLDTHPEAGDFKEYQSGVSRYEGGPNAWRQMFAKDHERFATAMTEAEDRFRAQGKTGAVLDAEMEQWTRSPDAYNAAIGERESVYDAPGDPTAPDFGFEEQESGSGGGTAKSDDPLDAVKSTIERYEKKMEEAIEKMRAAGYSVTTEDVQNGNPYLRPLFASFGVPAEMPEDYLLYLQWKVYQPAGVTVEGYLTYLRSLGAQQAAA